MEKAHLLLNHLKPEGLIHFCLSPTVRTQRPHVGARGSWRCGPWPGSCLPESSLHHRQGSRNSWLTTGHPKPRGARERTRNKVSFTKAASQVPAFSFQLKLRFYVFHVVPPSGIQGHPSSHSCGHTALGPTPTGSCLSAPGPTPGPTRAAVLGLLTESHTK